jgi:hypothetical protein
MFIQAVLQHGQNLQMLKQFMLCVLEVEVLEVEVEEVLQALFVEAAEAAEVAV